MYFFVRYVGLVIFCLFLAVFFLSIREAPLQIVLFVGASLAFLIALNKIEKEILNNRFDFWNVNWFRLFIFFVTALNRIGITSV